MKPVIALIGRPNVGKSTLFNRIIGKQKAIVEDTPGVTRDRNYAEAEHCGREFVVVDTGGFDPESREGMLALMKRQVEIALEEADAVVFVLDGREGVTPTDEAILELVRRKGTKTYVAVNKIDGPKQDALIADFYAMGCDTLWPISAENGSGVAELLDTIVEDLNAPLISESEKRDAISIAVIGRPNVGKSTFANALLGQERYLTSNVPGTTRDSVDTIFTVRDREFVLVDTAGIRRPGRVGPGLERMSVARSIAAMGRCHVVALIIDAVEGPTDQDKKLASLAIERGRGLILLVNKWDLVKGERPGDQYRQRLAVEFAFASWAPYLFISALTGRNVNRFIPMVEKVYSNLFRRIPTHELNAFFEEVVRSHPPQVGGTQTARIKYLTQVEVNPPTILLFARGASSIPAHYLRFLQRELRSRFDFTGVPLRLVPR